MIEIGPNLVNVLTEIIQDHWHRVCGVYYFQRL